MGWVAVRTGRGVGRELRAGIPPSGRRPRWKSTA